MEPPAGETRQSQGGAPEHRAQLRICHEKIGIHKRSTGGRAGEAHIPRLVFRWCDLPAVAWCYDCDHNICSTHLIAKHSEHRTQLEDGE